MKQLTKLEIRDFPFLGKCVFVGEDLVFVDISVPDLLCKTEEDLLVLKGQWRHPKKIDFILIMCCLKGSLSLRFNLAERKLSAGDMVVLPSKTIMEFEETSPDTQLVAVGFSKQVGVSELLLKTNPELLVHTMHYPVMHLDEPELADLLALHKVLITRMESDDFISKKAFFCSMMGVMFHLLSKNMRVLQSVESKNSQSQRIGEKFVNLLKQHGKREHDQDFYANKLCVSPKHLAWCVKEATGKTAKQWIDDFVVLEAKSMLKDHAYSISEISQILGFANQSSFGRFFKNATGTSPTDYGSVENGSVENQWG